MPEEDTWKKGDEVWMLSRQLDGKCYRRVVDEVVLTSLSTYHVDAPASKNLVRQSDCFRTRAEAAREGIRRASDALYEAQENTRRIHAAAAAQVSDADYALAAATQHHEWLHKGYSREAAAPT